MEWEDERIKSMSSGIVDGQGLGWTKDWGNTNWTWDREGPFRKGIQGLKGTIGLNSLGQIIYLINLKEVIEFVEE